MGKNYFQTVIFDMDGTLTDSVPLITQGVQEVISHYHLSEQTPQQLKRFVGRRCELVSKISGSPGKRLG